MGDKKYCLIPKNIFEAMSEYMLTYMGVYCWQWIIQKDYVWIATIYHTLTTINTSTGKWKKSKKLS